MTRARYIFDGIQSNGIAQIDVLISNQISEELFLDYKCVATPTGSGRLVDEDKKNLGKAISGFGNSDGGVVVWGVDCRNVNGIGDVPTGYQSNAQGPLKSFSPVWFKSMLEGLTSGATLPPHQGVQHLSLHRAGLADGVVVTYVPAGFSVPYRSISDGKDVYYIRSGSDFRPAPHGVLAALFGQRPQPIAALVCQLRPRDIGKPAPTDDHPLWAVLEITIKNTGRGMAEDIFILIDVASTPFRCQSNTLKSTEWQIEKDTASGWDGPRMAVTVPALRRLPPGGKLTVSFDLIAKDRSCDLSMEITAGLPGGPSASKRMFINYGAIEEAFSIYSETALERRHLRAVMDAISGKLAIEAT